MIVLWADDDIARLRPFGEAIMRKGCILENVASYEEAIKVLETRKRNCDPIQSLLLDVILPLAPGKSTPNPYLGLILADKAVGIGIDVKRIAFLTVVQESQIIHKIEELRIKHSTNAFPLYDKLELLKAGRIDQIISFLMGNEAIVSPKNGG